MRTTVLARNVTKWCGSASPRNHCEIVNIVKVFHTLHTQISLIRYTTDSENYSLRSLCFAAILVYLTFDQPLHLYRSFNDTWEKKTFENIL